MRFQFKVDETEVNLLPRQQRDEVLYAIYLLDKRALAINYNPNTKETQLNTPHDAAHLNSVSGGDWFKGASFVPPELSFLMLYLSRINVEIKEDGFYLVSSDPNIGLTRIAYYKAGKNPIRLEGKEYLTSHGWDLSNAYVEEFKELSHYQDQIRLIHMSGRGLSYKSKLPLSKVYTLEECGSDQINTILADLINVLAEQTSLELNTAEIRNERKYIYALSRIATLPNKMQLFSSGYLHGIYEKVMAYLN